MEQDAATARANFRTARLSEPAVYQNYVAEYDPFFRELIPRLADLYKNKLDRNWLLEFIANPKALDAFRYLAAPPVSFDDLEAIADTRIRSSTFSADPKSVDAVVRVVGQLLDPSRFPWALAGSKPSKDEIERAVIASTVLIASQRVATDRRNKAKIEQEGLVKDIFRALKFEEVAARPMRLITNAPDPLEFCGQAKLGSKQGDVFARLADERLLAIECKVSNSEVNSFKRIMNDSVSKATEWTEALGKNQVIPVAVLRGVFNPDNLAIAQEKMFLIWDHRLGDLVKFVKSVPAKPTAKPKKKRK